MIFYGVCCLVLVIISQYIQEVWADVSCQHNTCDQTDISDTFRYITLLHSDSGIYQVGEYTNNYNWMLS